MEMQAFSTMSGLPSARNCLKTIVAIDQIAFDISREFAEPLVQRVTRPVSVVHADVLALGIHSTESCEKRGALPAQFNKMPNFGSGNPFDGELLKKRGALPARFNKVV